MGTCSKNNFLQGHYNIVKVVNNNSVIFTRFSYLVIVYICLKALKFCSIKHKTRQDISEHWHFEAFSEGNASDCTWF